jgi:hypothetical protein
MDAAVQSSNLLGQSVIYGLLPRFPPSGCCAG